MLDKRDILEGLRQLPHSDIDQICSMTWHHQIRARRRSPELMDRREALMTRWLANRDLDDAAELILLIERYDLKGGPLPEHYDPEEAERMYQRLVRAQAEMITNDVNASLGIDQSFGLGRSINF